MNIPTSVLKNVFNERVPREIKSIDNVFGNFLISKGLYDEIEITKDNASELADLIGGHVKISIFCPECGESRVFSCESIPYYSYDDRNESIEKRALEQEIITWQHIKNTIGTSSTEEQGEPWSWTNSMLEEDTRIMIFKFFCAMDSTHRLDYIVLTYGNKMKKIGQYPSVADLSLPELKEYRKVMTKEDEKEFKRAVGLFASGIGIGSFVYLRRIFERIILSASEKAMAEGKIVGDEFNKAHVDEKIEMLEEFLPKTIVKNPVFYGIISKGIHELTEEECIEIFPIMQSFIMMVLIQWEKIRKDKEEEKILTDSLSRIAAKIK